MKTLFERNLIENEMEQPPMFTGWDEYGSVEKDDFYDFTGMKYMPDELHVPFQVNEYSHGRVLFKNYRVKMPGTSVYKLTVWYTFSFGPNDSILKIFFNVPELVIASERNPGIYTVKKRIREDLDRPKFNLPGKFKKQMVADAWLLFLAGSDGIAHNNKVYRLEDFLKDPSLAEKLNKC